MEHTLHVVSCSKSSIFFLDFLLFFFLVPVVVEFYTLKDISLPRVAFYSI